MTWSIDSAATTYRLSAWGERYFTLNARGDLCVAVDPDQPDHSINLPELVNNLHNQDLKTPLLIRFTDLLKHRLRALEKTFALVQAQYQYDASYYPIYPIKVNQQAQVISSLVQAGSQNFGLEAGSKPELLAVLASLPVKQGLIICNGYKDAEYIRLALMAQKMGHRVFLVIEKIGELNQILKQAAVLNLEPEIGVRLKLASVSAGNWQNSGGEKSKFGLNAAELLLLINRLKQAKALHWLTLLHVHMGSQIADIKHINLSMGECAQFLRVMKEEGIEIRFLDVGGGLGVDYEGTHSNQYCSVNYSLRDYAEAIVSSLRQVCQKNHLRPPHIITESGRWLTAHHAVLIIDVATVSTRKTELSASAEPESPCEALDLLIEKFKALESSGNADLYAAVRNQYQQLQTKFQLGLLNLSQLAMAEEVMRQAKTLTFNLLQQCSQLQSKMMRDLGEDIADTYFCNFSLFQSLPDVWGIDQIFPIMPISGLDKEPDRRAVLRDITCDSDGRIDHYVDAAGINYSLPLHRIQENETYYLAVFLVGAYQEILGDMHNLFGDLHSICVDYEPQNGPRIHHIREGESVQSVLKQVGFSAESIMSSVRQKSAAMHFESTEQKTLIQAFASALNKLTYLNNE